MKKNTVKGFFAIAIIIAASIPSFAQTPAQRQLIAKHYDQKVLSELAERFNKEYTENKAKAYELAVLKGWKVAFTDANGVFNELQGVTKEGSPIYAKTLNHGSAITNGAINLNSEGSLGLDLNGQDMLLGLWDGGHPLFNHNDLNGRAERMDTRVDPEQHPTHVLGTMIGSGAGNSNARGMAYQGNAWFNDWNGDMGEMTQQAGYGLLVSNHSYTFSPNNMPDSYLGTYNSYARSMDDLTYNAEYYQPVIAAGNDRDGGLNATKNGKDLLYCYGVSKNAIVVAAVNEVPNYTSASSVVMSGFSSYGPTDDFRVKPDISAKGVAVFSTSHTSTSAYATLQGTSMAAPSVTGVVALLQQHYSSFHPDEFLKAASVRGLLIHTAKEAGPSAGPDHMFGWGLTNAVGAAEVITNAGGSSRLEETSLLNGSTYTTTVYATGTEPLKITIAWTDSAGIVTTTLDNSSPRLINDLDLRVMRNGVEYLPWALTKNFNNPVAVRADNNADNIEKVEINTPDAGVYTVVVSHKGTLTDGAQNYTLIATGISNEVAGVDGRGLSLFNIWPNPANDVLNIDLTSGAESNASVKLYDIQGRVMLEQKLNAANNQVGVNSIARGIYVVSITNGNKTESKKIIVK